MTAKGIETMIFVVAIVLTLVGEWKILEKMGEKGWKSLVPFLGEYLIFKHLWNTKMFWCFMVASLPIIVARIMTEVGMTISIPLLALETVALIAAVVFTIRITHKLAKAFGHGVGFTVGLLFLPSIFEPVLGFGKSEYVGA